jgi:hypothetical protein
LVQDRLAEFLGFLDDDVVLRGHLHIFGAV